MTPAWYAASALMRDVTVTCPSLYQASSLFQHARISVEEPEIYLYELQQTPFRAALAQEGKAYLGVVHFSDVPYVFNNLQSMYYISDPDELALAARVSGSWAEFVSGRRPGSKRTLGEWETAFSSTGAVPSLENARYRAIGGKDDGMRQVGKDLARRCESINRLAAELKT